MKKLLMTASSWGHIRHFHLPYLRSFQQNGWQVHVGCANVPATCPEVDVLLELPFTKQISAPENFKIATQLRQHIQAQGYDLVICHTSLAAFFTRLAVMGLSPRPKLINMVHGYLFDDKTPLLKKAIYWGAEKVTAPVTDVVLTMNHWDDAFAHKHKLGKEVGFVPGIGVDFSRLHATTPNDALAQSWNIPNQAVVLLYPAEFSHRKNQQLLIAAMAELPTNTYLLLPGRGDLLETCKALAASLGVADRVIFPGFVEQMAPWYQLADIAVSASRSEGLPFNIMEALSWGLYVIASDVKGHQDLITAPELGCLYPYDSQGAFVNGVLHYMENTQHLRACAPLRQEAMERYHIDVVQPQIMDAYGLPQTVAAFAK